MLRLFPGKEQRNRKEASNQVEIITKSLERFADEVDRAIKITASGAGSNRTRRRQQNLQSRVYRLLDVGGVPNGDPGPTSNRIAARRTPPTLLDCKRQTEAARKRKHQKGAASEFCRALLRSSVGYLGGADAESRSIVRRWVRLRTSDRINSTCSSVNLKKLEGGTL